MSLLSHFLLLDQPKMRLFQVDKATIQVVEWHFKVIFCDLTSPKFDFCEVEKAMFLEVVRHWEQISFFLTNPKCDVGEVEKAKFQVSHVTLTHFRHLDHPNMRLG